VRRAWLLAVSCVLAACVTAEEGKDAAEKESAERAAVETAYKQCIAEGGFEASISSSSTPICVPANNEKQRERNLAGRAFEEECKAAGGSVGENNEKERSCIAYVEDWGRCDTSDDCTGTCMKRDAMVPYGFCGPARPLMGCFTEWGSSKPNRICAE
jgi:hypothetical protein